MISALFRLFTRTLPHLVRPITRPVTLFLLWTQRYTIGLWTRSLTAEAKRQWSEQRFDQARAMHLLRSLGRVSSDPRLANAPDLKKLFVDDAGGVVAEATHDWESKYLVDLRIGVNPFDGHVASDAEPLFAAQR